MANSRARINSIINSQNIGFSINGISEFSVNNFEVPENIVLDVPENLRLGKEIERIFSSILKTTKNYCVLQEGLQIKNGKITIGELDFIIENKLTGLVFHLELVYKFYLYDPTVSSEEINNWIGPNRKDCLQDKLEKLKLKQFPLLFRPETYEILQQLNISVNEQKLCFMANLFVPYNNINTEYKVVNNKAIVGYWLSFSDFLTLDYQNEYYLPVKSEWGIDPKYNSKWLDFKSVIKLIKSAHERNFSPLCWIKKSNNSFEQCFVVWW